MTRKQKKTLVSQVKQALLTNFANADEPLNEDKLARQFGVSRSPVRDTLKELEKEGLIQRRQKKGISLRRPSSREIAEIFDVRASLEEFAIRMAADRITPADLQSLEQIARQYDQALQAGNLQKVYHWDLQFHAKLIEITGNLYLKRLIGGMHLLLQVFQLTQQLTHQPQTPTEYTHQEIIRALQKKDLPQAAQLIHDHIIKTKEELLTQARNK